MQRGRGHGASPHPDDRVGVRGVPGRLLATLHRLVDVHGRPGLARMQRWRHLRLRDRVGVRWQRSVARDELEEGAKRWVTKESYDTGLPCSCLSISPHFYVGVDVSDQLPLHSLVLRLP